MNLKSKIKHLEKKLEIGKDKIYEYFTFYNLILVPDDETKEEAIEKHVKKHAAILNISFDRAKEAFEKVNPFYVMGAGKII